MKFVKRPQSDLQVGVIEGVGRLTDADNERRRGLGTFMHVVEE